MTETTHRLDTADLEARVKAMYELVALEPEREFHFETGRELAERLGYTPEDLDEIPGEAIDSFAGVGYFLDLAELEPGETVLDLGSGSGMDSLLAARTTGPAGRIVGVDMTAAQVTNARRLAANAELGNVEFHSGHVESPPVEKASVDCVISNGVINLCPDKAAVFRAVATVLRRGGRLALADIVSARQLPEGVTCDAALWAACIGGAMQRDSYLEAITDAGFEVVTVRDNPQYEFVSDRAQGATATYGVTSISVLARRT